jgi:hypothetical protein
VRTAGPIRHLGWALVAVRCATGGRGSADPEPLGRPSRRPALIHDAAGQPEPTEVAQGCLRVRHEDLLGRRGCWSSTPDLEVSLQQVPQDASPRTNLYKQYSQHSAEPRVVRDYPEWRCRFGPRKDPMVRVCCPPALLAEELNRDVEAGRDLADWVASQVDVGEKVELPGVGAEGVHVEEPAGGL